MTENKDLLNNNKSGAWLWQLGILVPDTQPTEYPICPFCTTSPFREFGAIQTLPDRCPSCGAKLRLEE